MELDDRTVQLAALWSSIGQFIIAAITLWLEIRRIRMSVQNSSNPERRSVSKEGLVMAFLILFGLFALVSAGIYWAAILISTASEGNLTQVVTRAAAWATFLGLGAGILIGLWLPKRLTRIIKDR